MCGYISLDIVKIRMCVYICKPFTVPVFVGLCVCVYAYMYACMYVFHAGVMYGWMCVCTRGPV